MTGDFFDLLERLVGAGVDFVIVGGFAYTPNAIRYFAGRFFSNSFSSTFWAGNHHLACP